jgi:hypothetical protein
MKRPPATAAGAAANNLQIISSFLQNEDRNKGRPSVHEQSDGGSN